ncbi:hypothetical protein WM46_22270 [Citrobacter freundii complex sp. CFNIH2]|nr:hypothetical protein WM46_22270 [Citrobacter freundii complex sp. CFNIH2]
MAEGVESSGESLTVVWLAAPLQQQLATLKDLLGYLCEKAGKASVLLICRVDLDWLWQFLPPLLSTRQGIGQIRIMDAGDSLHRWRRTLKGQDTQVSFSGVWARGITNSALTFREKQALYSLLEGRSVRELSEQLGLSPKTVYVHRYSAVHKIAEVLASCSSSPRIRHRRLVRELAMSYTWLSGEGM